MPSRRIPETGEPIAEVDGNPVPVRRPPHDGGHCRTTIAEVWRRWTGIPCLSGGHRTTAATAGRPSRRYGGGGRESRACPAATARRRPLPDDHRGGMAEVDGIPCLSGGHRTTAATAGRPSRRYGGGGRESRACPAATARRRPLPDDHRGGMAEVDGNPVPVRRPPHDGGHCRTTIAEVWRRWTGIEPAGRGSPVPPALKAGEPTRRSDTSAGDPTGPRSPSGRLRPPEGLVRRCRRRGAAASTWPGPRSGGCARG